MNQNLMIFFVHALHVNSSRRNDNLGKDGHSYLNCSHALQFCSFQFFYLKYLKKKTFVPKHSIYPT